MSEGSCVAVADEDVEVGTVVGTPFSGSSTVIKSCAAVEVPMDELLEDGSTVTVV